MRELEFIPPWYTRMLRRRRVTVIQTWATAAVLLLMGAWIVLSIRTVQVRQARLASLTAELDLTTSQVEKLDDLIALQKQLRQQDKILSRLGAHIDSTRLLRLLEDALPDSVALTELQIQTVESSRPVATPQRAAAVLKTGEPTPQRVVNIRFVGVSPGDDQLGNAMTSLSDTGFLDSVGMSFARDAVIAGRRMREFQVTAQVDLSGIDN